MAQKMQDIESKTESLSQDIIRLEEQNYNSTSSSTQSSTPFIYSVPVTLRQLKPTVYTPRIISIGFIHSENDFFKHTNDYKMNYMYSLFRRTEISKESRKNDVQETIDQCAKAMLNEASSVKNCYQGLESSALDDKSKEMLNEASRVKTCYQGLQSSALDDKSIARTMLVDGCFILELLMRWSIINKGEPCSIFSRHMVRKNEFGIFVSKLFRKSGHISPNEIRDDPIIGNNLVLLDVLHDLLLLENQIPFFVLEQLFELTIKRIPNLDNIPTLTDLILQFFGNMLNSKFKLTTEVTHEEAYHILGLLHSCYRPGKSIHGDYMIMKHSATDLHRSGVNFKPSKDRSRDNFWRRKADDDDSIYLRVDFQKPCLFSWLTTVVNLVLHTISAIKIICCKLHVSDHDFSEKPHCCLCSCLCLLCCRATLKLPQLCITDSTEPLLRNLIAFEQCSRNTPRIFTSYAFLMDTLIDSKEDVELLEEAKVLTNYLGTSEDASNLFNNLCKEVCLAEFYYSKQWEEVASYRQLDWPRRIASLRRTYFSSPWTGISVFAALILFFFTGIQTICSLISFLE